MVGPQFMPGARNFRPGALVVLAANVPLGLICLALAAVELFGGPHVLSLWWALFIPIALIVWIGGGILAGLHHRQRYPRWEPSPVDKWGRPVLRTTELPVAGWCLVLAFACLVLALTGVPAATRGQPDPSVPGCPYRLNVDHGRQFQCVSEREYSHVREATHRLFLGGAAAVCAFQAGLAVYILRRRVPDDHA